MKKKLRGLLSLWLAVMMVLTIMPAVFAEGEETPVTAEVKYYIGDTALEAWESEPIADDIVEKTITFDKALNTQTVLTLDSEKTHIGWRLWDYDGTEVRWPIAFNKDGVISQELSEDIADYLLEPVYQEEGFPIVLYKGAEALDPWLSSVPDDDPDYINFDLKIDSALDTQINTVLGDNEFTRPANHIQNGWVLWEISSGLRNPLKKGISDKVSYAEYEGDTTRKEIIEPTWKLRYWFTQQPTVEKPAVKVNDNNGVSFKWYNAEDNTIEIDVNASPVSAEDFDIEEIEETLTSSYNAETGWTPVSEAIEGFEGEIYGYYHYFFKAQFNPGDVLTVIPSVNDVLEAALIGEDKGYIEGSINDDGSITFNIDTLDNYFLLLYSESEDITVTASLPPTKVGESIATGAELPENLIEAGTFACEATWTGEAETPVVLISDPVTFEEVTITFDANGGEGEMDDVTVLTGTKYELPKCKFEAPEDMFFDGWTVAATAAEDNSNESASTEETVYDVGDKITVAENITVSAVWTDELEKVKTPVISPSTSEIFNTTEITITCGTEDAIIYYTVNGSDPTTSSAKYTKGFLAARTPTTIKAIAVKEGMEDSEIATRQYIVRSISTGGVSGGGIGGYGGGSSSSYTIKFDTNGGLSIANQYVKKNGYVTEPENPTKYGYTFEGWYADKELTVPYDFEEKVTKSFTLYAKWSGGEETDPFDDVSKGDWFYEAVIYAYENGLINGMSDNEYGPAVPLNRAMLVTILYRAEGSPAVSGVTNFIDIEPGSYYENAVMWAEENSIVNGMTETEFGPTLLITREQFATILYRYADYKGYLDETAASVGIIAPDADSISDWALEAMSYCVEKKIINGYEDGTIKPKGNTTRAEAAAMLQRFIEAN